MHSMIVCKIEQNIIIHQYLENKTQIFPFYLLQYIGRKNEVEISIPHVYEIFANYYLINSMFRSYAFTREEDAALTLDKF